MRREPAARELFFTKNDADDPRLGELAKPLENLSAASKNGFVILGNPDDEGVKLNGGRVGAAKAPTHIRKHLYKMTPGLESDGHPFLEDGGDLPVAGQTLEQRHAGARAAVAAVLTSGARAISLGGGHDYGFPDFAAFCEATIREGKKPFVINFDAHLDVRPDDKYPHSGTPFFKLIREFGRQIDFHEVGLQDWCNSRKHLEWALNHGAQIHTLDRIEASGLGMGEYLAKYVFKSWSKDHRLALSVDMDGFPSSHAPGASQVFPTGLDVRGFLAAWSEWASRYQPRLTGFYETNPDLDLDDRTSRLAAILIHKLVHAPTSSK